jgi:hypothetical protein
VSRSTTLLDSTPCGAKDVPYNNFTVLPPDPPCDRLDGRKPSDDSCRHEFLPREGELVIDRRHGADSSPPIRQASLAAAWTIRSRRPSPVRKRVADLPVGDRGLEVASVVSVRVREPVRERRHGSRVGRGRLWEPIVTWCVLHPVLWRAAG